jgi:hypothetical protein
MTKALLRDKDLSERYPRTPRTINAWKYKKILPPADLTIAGRDYWYAETIEANERERFSAAPSDISRLLADIATAPDEAYIVDLITNNLKTTAALSPHERQRVNAAIQDAVRERRACDEEK